MTERPDSEGGVFISTEKIYDLLRESIDRTNERLTEIRSDIQKMNEQNRENREDIRELRHEMEKVKETKRDRLTPSVTSALIALPISVASFAAPFFVK